MAIETQCPHGHLVRVKEHLAGRPIRCPTCATKFRVAAEAHLPLARLVPLAPEVVATLPRARPLAAGPTVPRPPASGPDPVDTHHDGGDALPPATANAEAAEPAPAGRIWEVVEADAPGRAEEWLDMADRGLGEIEPVPAAGGGPQTAFHPVISERPDVTWCIAFPGGDPTEPLDAVTMQAWLDGGHATGTEVVWRADWPEWRPVQDVFPELFGGGFRF
jgi:hypothetical protein